MEDLEIFGYCKQCGDPILSGEYYYEFDGNLIHRECFKDFIFEDLDVEELANILECDRKVAGYVF